MFSALSPVAGKGDVFLPTSQGCCEEQEAKVCARGYLFLFRLGITLDQECESILEDCHMCCTFEFCVLSVSVLMQESKSTWCSKLGIKGEQALSIYSNDAVATGDKICMSLVNFFILRTIDCGKILVLL